MKNTHHYQESIYIFGHIPDHIIEHVAFVMYNTTKYRSENIVENKKKYNNCKCIEAVFDNDKWMLSITELDGLRQLPKCGYRGPIFIGPEAVALYYRNDQDEQIYLDMMKKFLYNRTIQRQELLTKQLRTIDRVLKDLGQDIGETT